MTSLTEHQVQALSSYRQLMADYPYLFQVRNQRPIVCDFDILESYVLQHGIVLGIAATTPYVYFVVDLVESRLDDGTIHRHPYLRNISIGQLKGGINVVVLAIIQDNSLGQFGNVLLLEQERHATGSNELGLPRGFGEPGLSGEENALKELREETGYLGEQAHLLGVTYTDSGLTDSKVFFYYVPVTSYQAQFKEEEAIRTISLLSINDLWRQIDSSHIRDSFTIQALALYERSQYRTTI
jgi:ADP-ribose pyrophosphatase